MGENKKIPQIRFAGFTDDWEQRKLGDEAIEMLAGGDIDKSRVVENGKYPIFANALTNDGIVGYYDDYYRVKAPAVTVTGRGDVGHAQARTVDFTPIVRLLAIRSEHDVYFLENAINNHGVIVESTGVPQLTVPQLGNYLIQFPKTIEEETKIGAYFRNLDNLITLHQRKYDKLVQIKKSMLEKMFPQNGATKPEIRFRGFTDDWEQRKLSDIYKDIGNAFVGTATPYYVEDGHFYLESNNVKEGQINHNTEIFINDEFYEKQKDKWLHTGDMVMVQSGHVGHAAVIPEELDCSAAHALIMFRNPKVKIEPYFLNYQYQTNKARKKIDNITTGNTIKHILASDMQEFIVDVSSYEEQVKIAEFFRLLDNLITLHQRKLDLLKNMKKAMLEKMFV